jgi:hypothetical protein
MAIHTDNADILVIPVASAGYASRWIGTTDRGFVFYFQPKLCIGRTYKNRTSLGPCQIYPPYNRNRIPSRKNSRVRVWVWLCE